MKKARIAVWAVTLVVMSFAFSGCGDKFLDPTQVGRFRPVPAVNIILDSLGVAEETPSAWDTGDEPKPTDVVAFDIDYIFGPGDVVLISIFELFNQGVVYQSQYVVTETGKISIPDVGVVEAGGLTESQLEDEIKQILAPNIIKEPSVTVTLVQSQSKRFSILGNGVPRPGRYDIPRYDFRLADALATGGGISQFNISYIYVSRPITGQEEIAPEQQSPMGAGTKTPETINTSSKPVNEAPKKLPAKPEKSGAGQQDEMMEVIAPIASQGYNKDKAPVITSTDMITADGLPQTNETANSSPLNDGTSQTNEPSVNSAAGAAGESRIEWIFQDGRWVPVKIGETAPTKPATQPSLTKPAKESKPAAGPQKPGLKEINAKEPLNAGWDQIGQGGVSRRVIRVSADKLLGGDPHYNIVIRAGDTIHVPVDIIGEFCIMGNVNNQGFVNITGRPMTLKMAIASAGGLGPLAWPKKCEVIRRIGKKREEIVLVDLDKIASGEQPDFFIKPNDLVNVGTHPTARFRAVMRNAFRATYGFGSVYDRNFADRDAGTGRPFNFIRF